MYLRSSAQNGETQSLDSLPDKQEKIVIHSSDLYHPYHKDFYSCLLEEKLADDEKFQDKKWNAIHSIVGPKNNKTHLFYSSVSDHVKDTSRCFYLGDRRHSTTEENLQKILTMDGEGGVSPVLYLQKIHFYNKYSQFSGCVDALMHRSLAIEFLNVSPELLEGCQDYLMVYFYFGKVPIKEYQRFKAVATLHYFSRIFPEKVEDCCFLTVGENKECNVVRVAAEEIDSLKKTVCFTRRAKRIAKNADLDHIQKKIYYPNMKMKRDMFLPWKKKTAYELGEITGLWYCSFKDRERAFQKGVYSWYDEAFSPDLLGWPEGKNKTVLGKILNINRQDEDWIRVDGGFQQKWPMIFSSKGEEEDYQDFFVDFEWDPDSILYQIGVFYNGQYECFWATELNLACEKILVQQFWDFLSVHKKKRIWYWVAEVAKWRSVCSAHGLEEMGKATQDWYDMRNMMRDGTIVVKGALDFQLKSIVSAFQKQDKIPFSHGELDCSDGENSILFAQRYFKDKNIQDKVEIEKYNRMDCEAMSYILKEIITNA